MAMRWFETQRMNWLAKRTDPFNRSDLIAEFGISMPQASKDIQKFIKNNPNRLVYDMRNKIYEVMRTK